MTTNGKVSGVVYADKDGNQQRQKPRASVCVAGNSIESPRHVAEFRFEPCIPDGSGKLVRSGRQKLHAAHDRLGICGLRPTGAYVARHHHGWDHHRRVRINDHQRAALSAATRWRPCRLACPLWRPSSTRALGAASSPRPWTAMRTWPACGWWARTCRRKRIAVTLHARRAKDQYGLPVAECAFR